MSLLKQIDDKGAVLEWSPVPSQANLVALGTKDSSGVGFDDYGGELEIHMLDFANVSSTSSVLMGKARANSRFASLAWSAMATNSAQYPFGLIAGGMMDGNIHVWDPSKLAVDDEQPLIASVEQHQGAVSGLQFNPHKDSSHLLASGGSDSEVYVMSLERPDQPAAFIPAPPPNNTKHTADITKVAWNTQVAHILASAAQNGSCIVWDLRQKKAWCELRDPSGGTVADVAWNPDQGLHLVTASGDDKNPVIKLWDLRSSTSLPLATMQGHTEGILSLSWCPSDASLLLSCGKDNRTLLWDLFHLQPVYDLPSEIGVQQHGSEQSVFGGLASSVSQRRYNVQWSPCLPAVVSACSFDRRVQFYSLSGARSKLGRAPKWLRKPAGTAFGFGGKLVSFDSQGVVLGADGKKAAGAAKVSVSQIVEDADLVNACDSFHAAIASGGYKTFCEMKSDSAQISGDDKEKQVWDLMKVICFEKNAREELLSHLGFKSSDISLAAEEYIASVQGKVGGGGAAAATSVPATTPADSKASAEDVFGADLSAMSLQIPSPPPVSSAPPTNLSPAAAAATAEMVSAAIQGEKAEPTIRQAIIVGNFSAAVDCCLEAGLLAEALILAQCGDSALWTKTQEAFFERQRVKRPFLNILHAIIKSELLGLVMQSDLHKWRETLAVLSTYGKSEDFPAMCEALANRLEKEISDTDSATLCYMCAANVERTVNFWTQELKAANSAMGHIDTKALQRYVEKVVVFSHANSGSDLGPECSAFFAEYAGLLASQGRFDFALRYLKGNNQVENILIDRLYHAGNKPVGSRPPVFPFERVNVTSGSVAPQSAAVGVKAGVAPAGAGARGHQAATVGGGGVGAVDPRRGGPVAAGVHPSQVTQQHGNAYPGQQQQQHHQPVSTPQQSGGYVLPPGWVQGVDPASGRPYFFNQTTNQSQWEPPASAAPTPAPVAAPTPTPAQIPQVTHSHQYPQQTYSSVPAVGPSSVPSVATFASVGGGAHISAPAPAPAPTPAPAPALAPAPAPAPAPVVMSASDAEAVNALGQIIAAVAAAAGTSEKKQMAMVNEAFQHLSKKASTGEVAPEVIAKVQQLAVDVSNRNFPGASAIQADLANTVWAQHKDWIKGLKVFIQVAAKK